MTFSATGSPAPTATFEFSPDGTHWFEVPDANVTTTGDRTTVSVDIFAPIEADGWQTRFHFTNALGTTTTDAYVLHVLPAP
ncbi:MAG: hypothetical protein R2711_14600 [Acidimicrobiales bacterium]